MIDLLPGPEEQQVLDSFQNFFSGEAPVSRLRQPMAAPAVRDAQLWSSMAELGWFALALPAEHGGIGCGPAEEMLLLREAGRCLLSPALLGTVLAGQLAVAAGQRDLVELLIAGKRHVGIANPLGAASIGAVCSGDFHLLDTTDDGLVLVWDTEGAALVDAASFTGALEADGLDDNVRLRSARLAQVTPLAAISTRGSDFAHRAGVLVSAMLVGVADGARDLAVQYAKVREQFSKPIGAFQAIKHACVDMALRSEAAYAQTALAALALRDRPQTVAFEALASKIIAADAAIENATRCITVHGGMGFTAECDAHLFLKRAHVLNHVGGSARMQQARLAQLVRT